MCWIKVNPMQLFFVFLYLEPVGPIKDLSLSKKLSGVFDLNGYNYGWYPSGTNLSWTWVAASSKDMVIAMKVVQLINHFKRESFITNLNYRCPISISYKKTKGKSLSNEAYLCELCTACKRWLYFCGNLDPSKSGFFMQVPRCSLSLSTAISIKVVR